MPKAGPKDELECSTINYNFPICVVGHICVACGVLLLICVQRVHLLCSFSIVFIPANLMLCNQAGLITLPN